MFLHTSSEQFHHSNNNENKIIKCSGINLTKGAKGLYIENQKILLKEIKDNINKWKDILCSWFGTLNIVKMTILAKAIYRFNLILIRISMFFAKIGGKTHLKIHMESQGSLNSQNNRKKEQQNWMSHTS